MIKNFCKTKAGLVTPCGAYIIAKLIISLILIEATSCKAVEYKKTVKISTEVEYKRVKKNNTFEP